MLKDTTSKAIVGAVRHALNASIHNITSAQLLYAIKENQSLWAGASGVIEKIATCLPPSVFDTGMPMYRKALAEYGNTTNLVLEWLNQDNPSLYSTIVNTEGGREWFDRQVREICEKLELDYTLI